MKMLDVQNEITKYIEKNKLTLVDSLGKRYYIESFEHYLSCFNSIYNAYKNNIIEFEEEGKKYIDAINDFTKKAAEECKEENIEQYIINNFKRAIGFDNYNREVQLKGVHPKSFSIQKEASQEAYSNIYEELGYDQLVEYIKLVKSPSLFTSYLNDNSKQLVAMKFMLFKTNHHSPTKLKRDLSAKTIYQTTSDNVMETIKSITKEKDDFANYMKEQKEQYQEWFSNTANKLDQFTLEHSNNLSNIEKTYSEKLKVEEPAKFMLEQSEKYKKSFKWWCIAILGLIVLLLVLLGLIISPEVKLNDKLITITFLSKEMPVYSSIILLAMISLVVYILRIFIKMAISSKHLMEEYKQKYSLTYFYLSLINNGNIEDEKTKNMILVSLFSKADTGLIKNDSSNEIDKAFISLIK